MLASRAGIYGLANFFELGVFGRVGPSGLNAINRQAERVTQLTPAIRGCLDVLEAVIRSKPMREVEVTWREVPRFFAASDAALEAPRCGTGLCGLTHMPKAGKASWLASRRRCVTCAGRPQDRPAGAADGSVCSGREGAKFQGQERGLVH